MAKKATTKTTQNSANITKKKTSETKTSKRKTKIKKEIAGPTLFDKKQSLSIPENSGFNCPLFVSVDNDMAHHFWAQMSFFCKEAKETPHFFSAFSTTFDNVILLSRKPMLLKTESESEIHYPVAFELDCALLTNLECYSFLGQKVSKDRTKLAELSSQDFDYIAVKDLVPFTSVKRICFLSDENRNRFFSYPTKNIVFNNSLASTCPDQFEKSPEFGSKLKNAVINIKSLGKQIKRINHIRAALLACLNCFKKNIFANISSSFDKLVLRILFTGTQEEFEREYKSLKRKLSEFLAENGNFPILENNAGESDSTILEMEWLINTVLEGRVDTPSYNDGLDSKDTQTTVNLYAYRVLSLSLLTEPEYIPIKFIDRYQNNLMQNSEQLKEIKGIDENQINSILDKYNLALDKLKQIIKGLSFQKNPTGSKDYSTLKAFYDFTLAYSGEDHFESLLKRFDLTDNISDDHKRLTWSLYGLSYGMYAINNPFRYHCDLILRLIDKRLGCSRNNREIGDFESKSNEIVKTKNLIMAVEFSEYKADVNKMIDFLESYDKEYLQKIRRDLAKRIVEIDNEN